MSNCFRQIPKYFHSYLREHFFVEEVVNEVMRGTKRFYEGPGSKPSRTGRSLEDSILRPSQRYTPTSGGRRGSSER